MRSEQNCLTSAERSANNQSCEHFLSHVVDRIDGWLDRFAAKRTFDLLQAQERHLVTGALYEVGLYHGKYFSLLVHAGVRSGSTTIGIDTFDYVPAPTFTSEFVDVVSPYVLNRHGDLAELSTEIIQNKSTDIGPSALRSRLGGDARFISIDGSHEFDDVLWDLGVAQAMLAPGGIIAVDDYLHPICLGVTAATDRFLANSMDVVPFAYVANKLFLARPGWADRYRSETEWAIIHDEKDPKGRAFKMQVAAGAAGRGNIEAAYAGYRILTVAM